MYERGRTLFDHQQVACTVLGFQLRIPAIVTDPPFRIIVTGRFGMVTDRFGTVTGHFGDRDRQTGAP